MIDENETLGLTFGDEGYVPPHKLTPVTAAWLLIGIEFAALACGLLAYVFHAHT